MRSAALMPRYVFQPQVNDEPPAERDAFTHELADDTRAIENGRPWFQTVRDFPGSASLEIGRYVGEEIEWLGAWDWEHAREPEWSPDD